MTENVDGPFQMDEDISGLPNNVSKDDPRYSEIQISKLTQSGTTLDNDTPLRSKLNQLKLEEKENNATTIEEEEEKNYDEDVDDKLDVNLQKKLQLEYEEQQKQHKKTIETVDIIEQDKQYDFDVDDQPLTPPENFALVIGSIYRSSFPQPANFSFLKQLKLKSVLCLIPEEYPELQQKFFETNNVKLFQLGMSGNKEPFVKISSDLITQAIKIVLDPENQPILIHCNRGKHRTGCLIGVLRRLQNWSKTIIFDEYRKFAAPKERPMDQQFIELYDDRDIKEYCNERGLLPLKWG
ncbi:Siw14 protein phosphatase [Candida orthopsilosis Co 90-125]|uniref:diphosphoinositol-polyphosphate diphosphatase n=1 Tax=Candida orthopsilosis (strain 90-125) TaxID=1136231 RepID=H8X583_CANO9|nr:Siw14 protein phosphatase [Candida orthopsilosis Co 90-125]CCG23176.1 Siw14 protein phosphatase [Candida orthopsilosis Co 90-125]